MFELVALMPMRHNSERVRGKNYREFGDGRPLFFHMADKLLKCDQIDKLVINTDSTLVKKLCKSHFPDIIVIDRPEYLSDEHCPMNDIIQYDINQIPANFYIQTHSTNPLLSIDTLNNSLQVFKENFPKYDSLFSVTRQQTRFWDSMTRPINHNPKKLIRTQDLPPIYEENSCIYIFSKECLLKNKNRIGRRPFLYEIDKLEAVDIDTEIDFIVAEKIFQSK